MNSSFDQKCELPFLRDVLFLRCAMIHLNFASIRYLDQQFLGRFGLGDILNILGDGLHHL